MNTYTVKAGDTLSTIARDILGEIELWPEIALINNIGDPDSIQPGQELVLPNVLPTFTKTAKPVDNKKILIVVSLVIVIIVAGIIWYRNR